MSTLHNVTLQLKTRQNQLRAIERQIKSGAYSAEDVAVLQERAAALRRMIAMYRTALKSA